MSDEKRGEFGEPWKCRNRIGAASGLREVGGRLAVECSETLASRVAECVNAFAGIEDPAAELARLRNIEEAAKVYSQVHGHNDCSAMELREAMNWLRAAMEGGE